MDWYYAEKGQQIGPLDDEAFQNLVSSGKIPPTTLVWNSSMTDWKPVSEVGSAPTSVAVGPAAHCGECGGRFATEDMIQFGETWVCANCKPLFTQKLREGVSLTGAKHYAGFWIRVLAALIDGIVMWIVAFGVVTITGAGLAGIFAPSGPVIALEYLVGFVYNILLVSRYGGTAGKLVLGLRIVNSKGENLSLLHAIGRYFAHILSAITLGIGYLMVAFDNEKRGLHDRICNTRVIKK